jgi:hypothetical protein
LVISNPVPLADFFDKLPRSAMTFQPYEPRELNRTRSGRPLSASIGDPVWRGSITVAAIKMEERAAEIEALMSLIDSSGGLFEMYDYRQGHTHPYHDPDGSILGSATPTIYEVNSNRLIRLGTMPVGYVITPGDLLGYSDPNGKRRLHRVVSGGTVNVNGRTPDIQITPPIFPYPANAPTTGEAVQLIKPVITVQMIPNPSYGSSSTGVTNGFAIDWVQAL